MANSSETKGTSTTASTGTGTGGSQGTGPHPKRTLEIILLSAILILVAYNTYITSQNHQLLQSQQAAR